jgi:8-amino-7-oxononanoate synthase
LIECEAWRREHLRTLVARIKTRLADGRWRLLPSDTAIQPVVLGASRDAVALSSALAERGLLVPAIRPPTVPRGTARLRISLSAAHRMEDLERLLTELQGLGAAA